MSRFLSENIGAPTPRQDEQHHRRAEQDRRPSAFEQFEQIGREEDDIHENERGNDEANPPQRPMPKLPDHDEGEQTIDHHGGGDRDAVGGCECARRTEQADQQQNADEQRAGDARDINLPCLRR